MKLVYLMLATVAVLLFIGFASQQYVPSTGQIPHITLIKLAREGPYLA
jgi:hypothetical protein